jgi:hypothetical protein
MSNENTPKIEKYFANSCLIRNNDLRKDVVVVNEKLSKVLPDGTRKWGKRLRIIDNPKRNFWITQPQFRNYDIPREFETVDRLDRYTCHNYDLRKELYRRLHPDRDPNPRFVPSLKKLCSSPYIYGADIGIETLIKKGYSELGDKNVKVPYKHASEDIEASIGQGETGVINIQVIIVEQHIYAGMLAPYMFEGKDDLRIPVDKDYVERVIREALHELFSTHGSIWRHKQLSHRQDLFDENDHIPFELTTYVGKDEKDLLLWCRSVREHEKPDYVAYWNIDFDIPYINERLEENGIDIASYWTSDEVLALDPELAYADYRRDNVQSKQKQHIGDKWHCFNIANYMRFYCAMATYARVRKASGRKPSLSLEYTGKDVLGVGKFSFGKYVGDNPFCDVYTIDADGEHRLLVTGKRLKTGQVTMLSGKKVNTSYGINLPLVDNTTGDTVITSNDILQGLYDVNRQRLVLDVDDHAEMRNFRYPEYVAYCVVDAILPQIMAWANSDHETVISLIENSLWTEFDKQSVMLKNNFYTEWYPEGKIVCSVGEGVYGGYDDRISKAGGTVLRSADAENVGLRSNPFIGFLETLLNIFVSDIDAGSMYPTIIEIMNIARETKLATIIDIGKEMSAEGNPIEYVYNCTASPKENAGLLGPDLLGLQSYEELYEGFMQYYTNVIRENVAMRD